MSLPSTECPVAGATTRLDCGNCDPTRSAFSTGVRRSSSPSSRSTGTSGSGPGPNSGARGAFGQRSQRLSVSLARAVARSKGSNAPSGIAAALAAACRWRSAGSGGVLRSQGSGASSQLVAAYSAVLNGRGFGGGSASTSTARLRSRRSGVGSPSQRGAHRAREGGAQDRLEVAREEDREHVHASETPHSRPALPVDHPTAYPAAPKAIHEIPEVGRGIARPGAVPATERAQRARRGRERVQVERIRAIHLGDRIEHQAVHPLGITQRVAQRDLRSVRRSVQSHLLGTELLAQRVDVVGCVAARVEGPARPEPPGAGSRRVSGVQKVGALERPAAKQPGAAAAALVVDHEVAVAVERIEHAEAPVHLDAEGVRRRLARPAGEHDHAGAAWRRRGGARAPSSRTARRGRARSPCGRAAPSSDRTGTPSTDRSA